MISPLVPRPHRSSWRLLKDRHFRQFVTNRDSVGRRRHKTTPRCYSCWCCCCGCCSSSSNVVRQQLKAAGRQHICNSFFVITECLGSSTLLATPAALYRSNENKTKTFRANELFKQTTNTPVNANKCQFDTSGSDMERIGPTDRMRRMASKNSHLKIPIHKYPSANTHIQIPIYKYHTQEGGIVRF